MNDKQYNETRHEFTAYLRARKLARTTVLTHLTGLKTFIRYLDARGIEWRAVAREEVTTYVAWLQKPGRYAPGTVHTKLTALKSFYFLGSWGRPYNPQIAARMVRKYAEEAGIKTPVSCHSLRHAYASHLLQSGRMNAVDIRDLLGHSRLSTTQRYLHLLPHSHKAIRYHPLEVGQ